MNVTIEEFKELVELTKKVYNKANEYGKYISEEAINDLAYPILDWIDDNLEEEFNGMLYEIAVGDVIPVWDDEGEYYDD